MPSQQIVIVEPVFPTLALACAFMQQQPNPVAFFVIWVGATNQWKVTAIEAS